MNFQKKILVIEDDKNSGVVIQYILKHHQYDVCFADNGASGIQKAFEYNPDLILCDVNMSPVNGYQVYKVLEESSLLNRIPFIFLTGNSELDEIRSGLALGADDYLFKPIHNDDLIHSIEKRLEKFRIIKEESKREFMQLFDISPNGLFLFDGNKIYKTNLAFRKLIKFDPENHDEILLENILCASSVYRVQSKIKNSLPDSHDIFNEVVTAVTRKGKELQLNLTISKMDKYSNFTLYLGLFSKMQKSDVQAEKTNYAAKVYNLLKHENITISESLEEKITNIFKQKTLDYKKQTNTFFSKRENEVLCLSMEGLPIKNIADKLAISDRTVEKHRTKLMEKAGANNMIEVIVFALKNSLVEI